MKRFSSALRVPRVITWRHNKNARAWIEHVFNFVRVPKNVHFFSGRAVLFQFSRPLSGASRTAVKTGNEPVPCSVPRYRSVASVPATIMNLW